MNCNPGDLAYITVPGRLYGCVVRVLSLDPIKSPCGRPMWLYEGHACYLDGSRYESLWDHILRPIRPSEGQDETLAWCSVPNPTKETV